MPTAVGALMGSPAPGRAVTAAMKNAKSMVVTKRWGVADAGYDLRLSEPEGTQSYGARTRTSRRTTEGSCHKFGRHPRTCRNGNRSEGLEGKPSGAGTAPGGARRATFFLCHVTQRANRHASHRPDHDPPGDQRRRERAAGHLDAARPTD